MISVILVRYQKYMVKRIGVVYLEFFFLFFYFSEEAA